MLHAKLRLQTGFLQKLLLTSLIYMISLLIFTSCESQSPISAAEGDVKVLVPLVGAEPEKLSTVTLKNIGNLKEVSGSYVRFYYTPGAKEGALTGGAPQARFIRTKDGTYVPTDIISQQMVTLYYHIQNLNDFNAQVSSDLKQTSPFSIGLNTQISGNAMAGLNNAFFDGQANALLFVPYKLKNFPITVNAGIIAHEFFHSIFYKHVLKDFNEKQDALVQKQGSDSDDMKAFYFNQTYVRGLNEGLADYWGWVYTSNIDYISASLPEFGVSRKMELEPGTIGQFETQKKIENRVSEAQALAEKPSEFLSGYIYRIGTPHARFLKELTIRLSRDNEEDLQVTKLKVAQSIFKYLKSASISVASLSAGQVLSADGFFNYMAQPQLSGINLTADQCDFVLKYIDVKAKDKKQIESLCKGSDE